MGRRGLQCVLSVLALVAVAFGGLAVLTGTSAIPGATATGPNVDSELRFYAAWYVAAGVALLRVARRPETEGAVLRLVCAALLLGAAGRVLSWIAVGRPSTTFVVLLGIEIVIPLVVVPWHHAVAAPYDDREAAGSSGAGSGA